MDMRRFLDLLWLAMERQKLEKIVIKYGWCSLYEYEDTAWAQQGKLSAAIMAAREMKEKAYRV